MNIVTISDLRSNLKVLMDQAADRHEPVIVKRPRGDDMVLMAMSDYESLKETAYLLGNEANAERLRRSLKEAEEDKKINKGLLDE